MRTKRKFVCLIVAVALIAWAVEVWGQCPNGVCRIPRTTIGQRAQTRACHRAVCRIQVTQTDGRQRFGSGVLIRYMGRFVVLTARHVVAGIRGPINVGWGLGHRKHWQQAKLLGEDSIRDVAVLEVTEPPGIKPAEIAWGKEATPKAGDWLEACGFGMDDTFRVNPGQCSGRYIAPRLSPELADWFEISGAARLGDSGGPIFDRADKVVGILSRTSKYTTVATQGGRVHYLLNRVIKRRAAGKCLPFGGRLVPVKPLIRPIEPRQSPSPQVIVNADPAVRDSLGQIGDTLTQIEINTRPPTPETEPVQSEVKMSPLLAGLIVLGSVVVGFVLYFGNQKG